ncbi:ATP-grasp domain-containing protein [Parasphingorhabdus pacifica]
MREAEGPSEQSARPFGSSGVGDGSPTSPAIRPAPLLLQGQDYFFRSPNDSLDFQERMHRAGMVDDRAEDPVPCVLVLARAADMEMDELSLALAERNIRMIRVDADRCMEAALTVYTDAPLIEFERWLLRPLLVWRRHFDISALRADPTTVHGAYVREQWTAVANWLSRRSDWQQVNPIRSGDQLDRLTQLSDAAAFGFRVPRTAVTTRPGRNRPGGGRCIIKTAGHHLLEPDPGALRGLFPQPLDIRREDDAREPAPVLVQQYVESDHELRIFVVGDEVIGYRVDKLDPAQLWVDPDAVVVERVELPADVAERALALSRHWGLHVVALDLLVAGGEHVFLEVNVNCDWRWFEHRAGCSAVSETVHSWLGDRFEELAGSGAGAAPNSRRGGE